MFVLGRFLGELVDLCFFRAIVSHARSVISGSDLEEVGLISPGKVLVLP